MLIATRGLRRGALPVVTLLLLAFAVFQAPHAAAAKPVCLKQEKVISPNGGISFKCVKWGFRTPGNPGGGGNGGGGGPVTPSCNLVSPATFCKGQAACWYSEWGVPWAIPQGPKPSEDAEMKIESCRNPDGTGYDMPVWVGDNGPPPEPPLEVQAQEAIAAIELPRGRLRHNPTTRAFVNIPTWLWVDGVSADPLRSQSAFGLVVIARPDHLEFKPGDGAAIRCPWSTSAEAAEKDCAYTYKTSSARGSATAGGQPAFGASVVAVWTLEFENDGAAVDLPAVQQELRSPAWEAAIPVAEVQSVVGPNGQ